MNARGNEIVWVVVFCVAALLLLAAGLSVWDAPTVAAVRAGGMAALDLEARFLSRFGDFPFLLGGGVAVLAACLVRRRPAAARVVVAMILAGVLAGLASNAIKLGTGRVRPRSEDVGTGWHGPVRDGQWVSLRHAYQSFPSSHAACAFGFFFPLFLSRRLAGAAGLVVAALIAWSRVQLNAHHISDVAAGALLGVLAGWLVWDWLVRRGGLARWLGPA
jgi:membrane-associated phospholipid phosphatase